MTKIQYTLIFSLRVVAVLGCFGWCVYFAAMVRTSGFGLFYLGFLDELVFPLILMMATASLPFLGLNWRCIAIGVSVILGVSFLVAESYGRAQEILVMREYGDAPTEAMTIVRWWPFEHHSIFYSPRVGWSGCD